MANSKSDASASTIDADAVVVGVFSDSPLAGAAADIDRAAGGVVARLIESKEISADKYEVASILAPAGVTARQVAVVGLGKREELNAGVACRAAGAAAKRLATKERNSVAYYLAEGWDAPLVESAVAGAVAGAVGQDLYRAKKKLFPPNSVSWMGAEPAAIESGKIVGESINLVRRLVNGPPDEIYPETLANAAVEMSRAEGIEVEVWDGARLASERCGALLAVARGSSRDPRLVMMRYRGAAADAPILGLVGKGVTFDSGGLSLKPSESMLTMKCDMAGAATVIGAMQAIARLKLPVNVTGLIGLVENMTGPAAFKLGDVLHARNGTTIEVHNTDAEGRLVLADVLDVALEQKVSKIVDLATLTGACVVALGLEVVGAMSNRQAWCETVLAAARDTGELIWQLPMFPEYDELIKSDVADIKNVGQGRWGGAITAAKFLERFVGETPWTHLDIAGPAFRDTAKPWSDAGASGVMLRTLVELARGWK